MAVKIPRSLVEYILLGPAGDRRQLQDSPVLGDVWIAYADKPGQPQELLITPQRAQVAGRVAAELDDRIKRAPHDLAEIAYLQGVIAARLYFGEVLRVIVPMSEWWKSPRINKDMQIYLHAEQGWERLTGVLDIVQRMVAHWSAADQIRPGRRIADGVRSLRRARRDHSVGERKRAARRTRFAGRGCEGDQGRKDGHCRGPAKGVSRNFGAIPADGPKEREALIFQVSLNRTATMALARSVPAVKADAARTLFSVNCSEIAWAVIDSGIQGNHPSFKDAAGNSRVKSSFDFSNIRKIISLDNLRILGPDAPDPDIKAARLKELLHDELKDKPGEEEAVKLLTELARDTRSKRPIHWESVKPFVEVKPESRPRMSDHGTHVAGIIGASGRGAKDLPKELQGEYVDGMCPDIQLYDFRVLAPTIKETEFAIIAALQYIRHLNGQNDYTTIHGANLSLSIPHDVRNYACGGTPVCVECERLVDSGVVVVAAAGNLGYQSFQTQEGSYESYAAFSVTDPGNADGVITVGATHRYSPHTYGVSFFSSRGPTGDGRAKPDLVAPGERIRAPFRDDGWGDLDGTSMAAPHVSGAAAMLMARYSELIGMPRRIKQVLCESATDLGRERSFQGHGMLDVLRAFQSI